MGVFRRPSGARILDAHGKAEVHGVLTMKGFMLILGVLYLTCAQASDETPPTALKLLPADNQYNGIIIQPEWRADHDDPLYLVVKPDTRQLVVTAAPQEWKQEQASFAQFRQHYMVYWSLFMVMMILDAAWVE